jgi:hypothetical protein
MAVANRRHTRSLYSVDSRFEFPRWSAALAMSTVYSKQISELSGVRVRSVVFGQSLLRLGIVLCVLSIASTLGSVLTSRSWKVTSHLAR